MSVEDAELSVRQRGWRDAKAYWGSLWFLVPVALVASAATVASAFLPADAEWWVVVAIALASAAGVPFVLGFLVLVVAFALAPGRQRYARLNARLERLEGVGAAFSRLGTSAPSAPIHVTGGTNVFNIGAGTTGPIQTSAPESPPEELPESEGQKDDDESPSGGAE